MERNPGDVARVALKCEYCGGICGLDVVELDSMMSCRGEEAFVWGYAQPIDLRVRVRNGPRADATEGFPEAAFRC